jgi:hypothetical protein
VQIGMSGRFACIHNRGAAAAVLIDSLLDSLLTYSLTLPYRAIQCELQPEWHVVNVLLHAAGVVG